jgi:hypothetical protein
MENPGPRSILLHMAHSWLRLAEQAEKNKKTYGIPHALRGDSLLDPPGV